MIFQTVEKWRMGRLLHRQSHKEGELSESALLQGERARYLFDLFAQSLLFMFAVLLMRLKTASARLRGDGRSENALDRTIKKQTLKLGN